MFGYVTASAEMPEERRKRYRAYYCGLCRNLGRRYGAAGRMTLRYDPVFLYMLLSSLYEPEEQCGQERCLPHPMKEHEFVENPLADYAADVNLLLSYHKCMDDWQDEHRLSGRAEAGLLQKSFASIEARHPEKSAVLKRCLDEIHQVEKSGTLEPAQKAYNEHYVCDYPLGLAGLDQYRAQHESLVRIDLERYAARLEQAQRDCKDRFRKDILFRMKDDIFNARRQFRELNKVMEQLTYGEEVYRFELEPSRDPQLAAFYQIIVDKGNQQMTEGDSLDNLAATADPAYERQVDALMEKIMADVDENTRARQEGRTGTATLSDYVDYRTYLDYDIKVTNRVTGQQAYLSRVSRDSSGGENQAPFYVAICASLLQIYQKSENSIRLVLLDEAFSKMTSDRIRPMMELFRRLQLQVLLISTVEKSTAIQPYCDITYSIVRHGDANAIAPFVRLSAE